ncbi:hypothetical protein ACJRO7_021634 [Eucalyptus globulus]|uniref:Uncharacterized protein n=1 Tax=Eucalyptus globulus TaxID=34317 RepID=A0ABD3KLA2_EUCGL
MGYGHEGAPGARRARAVAATACSGVGQRKARQQGRSSLGHRGGSAGAGRDGGFTGCWCREGLSGGGEQWRRLGGAAWVATSGCWSSTPGSVGVGSGRWVAGGGAAVR